MINGCKVKIENNNNIGDIIINVHYYNSLDCALYQELSKLNQEEKEIILKFIRKYLKNK